MYFICYYFTILSNNNESGPMQYEQNTSGDVVKNEKLTASFALKLVLNRTSSYTLLFMIF